MFKLTRVTSHHIAYLVVLRTFLIVDCSHTLIPFTCVNLSVRVELLYSFLSLACLYRFTGCLLVTSWPRVTSSLVCRISGGRFVVYFTLNILYSLSLSLSLVISALFSLFLSLSIFHYLCSVFMFSWLSFSILFLPVSLLHILNVSLYIIFIYFFIVFNIIILSSVTSYYAFCFKIISYSFNSKFLSLFWFLWDFSQQTLLLLY